MINNQLWIIDALIIGAALLGVRALYWIIFRSSSERKIINRRLALGSKISNPAEVLNTLRRERGFHVFGGVSGFMWLDELVVQTGLKIDPVRAVIALAATSALFYALLALWFSGGPSALVAAVAAALIALYVFLRLARARRISKFGEQLPEALDIVVRGLRSGHPFRVALGLVAREMPDPIGTEFGIMLDEITFGVDQQVAVNHLTSRVGLEDLAFVAIAVNIQTQTGGNLGEILQTLSRMLRNRSKLRMKVRALTSEGRLSAVFMSVMPFILIVVVNLISPSYYGDLRGSALVTPAVIVGLSLLALGNFVMYRMVNFRF